MSAVLRQDAGTEGFFDWNPHLNLVQSEAEARVPDVDIRLNTATRAAGELALDVDPRLNFTTTEAEARFPAIDMKLNRSQSALRR